MPEDDECGKKLGRIYVLSKEFMVKNILFKKFLEPKGANFIHPSLWMFMTPSLIRQVVGGWSTGT